MKLSLATKVPLASTMQAMPRRLDETFIGVLRQAAERGKLGSRMAVMPRHGRPRGQRHGPR